MTEVLSYSLTDGVATLTLNRPDAMNALDTELKVALRDRLQQVASDDAVRAVLLTGAGRAFCVGQDLAEHARNLDSNPAAVWETVPAHYTPIASAPAMVPTGLGLKAMSETPPAIPAIPPHSALLRPRRRTHRSPVRPMTMAPAANAEKCRLATV